MVWNKEGFLIPKVDTEACINCGLCVKQCIALENKQTYTDDPDNIEAWGGWNKDSDIHLNSSSGGIFSALAEHVISAGGCVFGVVWKDKYTAIFDKAENIDELVRMRGSKYTPALTDKVYQHVLTELKTGRKVLFSGTPCQVHALKRYLRKPYSNLLTIDIVCHGMPSHLLLEKYIDETECRTGKTVDYVSFRDKPEGWLRFHVSIYFSDGSITSSPLDKDIYMRMFLCDKALNYVCYNCPYAHLPRQGDITLGDYWGVERLHPDWPIERGISAILTNSQLGSSTLAQLTQSLHLLSEPFCNIHAGQGVVYIRPHKQIPATRNIVLHKLLQWPLGKVYDHIVNTVELGPIRIPRTSIIFKILHAPYKVAKWLKQKLITPVQK